MKKSDKAVELFNNGHLCSQAVLKLYTAECGITDEQAMKLGTGFGTGMKKGEVCGACTGALMVLGLLYGQKDPLEPDQRKDVYNLSDRFLEEFSKRHGSYICNDILKCDVSTEKGFAYARENRLFLELCPKFVKTAAEILEEIIEDRKQETKDIP